MLLIRSGGSHAGYCVELVCIRKDFHIAVVRHWQAAGASTTSHALAPLCRSSCPVTLTRERAGACMPCLAMPPSASAALMLVSHQLPLALCPASRQMACGRAGCRPFARQSHH